MNSRRLLIAILSFCLSPQAAYAAFNGTYVGDMTEYRAAYEDTFVHLARDYNLGYVEMRAANPGIDPWVPGAGTKLILPTRHLLPDAPREGVVINLPEMRLYAYVNGEGPPETFPLGIGREGLETPVGTTTVVRKVVGPIWRPTPRMRIEKPELPEVMGPGPENPMGTHALYLGWNEYAIHGTNRPFGIGRRVSSGCIRLYPEGIIRLYDLIPVGTRVTVVNQPIKVAWIGDELFLEVHQTVDQTDDLEEIGVVRDPPKLTDADMERIIRAAGPYKDKLRWSAIRNAVRERRGYPVPIARKSYGASVRAQESLGAPEPVKVSKEDIRKSLEEVNAAPDPSPPVVAEKKVYRDNLYRVLNP